MVVPSLITLQGHHPASLISVLQAKPAREASSFCVNSSGVLHMPNTRFAELKLKSTEPGLPLNNGTSLLCPRG